MSRKKERKNESEETRPSIQTIVTAEKLPKLRKKLLDTSKRNRLISFKHSETARTHLRVIDERMDVVWQKLEDGKKLFLNPLPAEELEPDDEKKRNFKGALKEFISVQRERGDLPEGGEISAKRERELRDQVRERLGMRPRVTVESSGGLEAYVREHGLEPSYDLPPTPDNIDQLERRHTDNKMQTLLLPPQFQRKSNGVRDHARQSMQERGVNTLYIVYGFLEWYESDSSDIKILSPLLLEAVELTREKKEGEHRFSVDSPGDGLRSNVCLAARLAGDFGFVLPDLGEEESPETYFGRLEELISKRQRWSLRRFITIGHFAFARLVIYNDLDPDTWNAGAAVGDHSIVQDLLGGTESTDQLFAEEYEVDDPAIEAVASTIVLDADSSQHSAVIDVIKGKNLVIEGPPGTGKSQTICNIIAATLADGKSVLFVAEKLAALEVVKKRLDEIGLGEFCLELHSTKSSRHDVLASLEERFSLKRPRKATGITEAQGSHRSLKRDLNEHSKVMASEVGATGETVQQILWREIATRKPTRLLPDGTDEVKIGAIRLGAEAIKDHNSLLKSVADVQKSVGANGGISQHPWRWWLGRNLSPAECGHLVKAAQYLSETIDHLKDIIETSVMPLPAVRDDKMSFESVARLIGAITDVRAATPQTLPGTLQALDTNASLAELDRLLKSVSTYQTTLAEISPKLGLNEGDDLEAISGQLESLVASISKAGIPGELEFGEIAEFVSGHRRRQVQLGACLEWYREVIGLLGIDESPPTYRNFLRALAWFRLLHATERDTLLRRSPGPLEETSSAALRDAERDRLALRAMLESLGDKFDSFEDLSPDELKRHARSLRSKGFLSGLKREVREAKALYRQIEAGEPARDRRAMASRLRRLADFLAGKSEWENGHWWSILPDVKRDLETSLQPFVELNAWGLRVRTELAGADPLAESLRDATLHGTLQGLDSVLATSDVSRFEKIQAFLDETSHENGHDLTEEDETMRAREQALTTAMAKLGTMTIDSRASVADLEPLREGILSCCAIQTSIQSDDLGTRALGKMFVGVTSDIGLCRQVLDFAEILHSSQLSPEDRSWLMGSDDLPASLLLLFETSDVFKAALADYRSAHTAMDAYAGDPTLQGAFRASNRGLKLPPFHALLTEAIEKPESLSDWLRYCEIAEEARDEGLGDLLDCFEKDEAADWNLLPEAFERATYRELAQLCFDTYPSLNSFTGVRHAQKVKRFRKADKELYQTTQQDLRRQLLQAIIPAGVSKGRATDRTELALILHEIGKQKRHIPIRELLARSAGAVRAAKPCIMMSPLSVAQYLKPSAQRFDLLVIDEASQMRPEDALSAVARSNQIVVVGDPKQLPPTSFFSRFEEDDEDDEEAVESESILDLGMSVFRPARRLRWHYRSRDGSLIAFSNRHFYGNDLIVFPSPYQGRPDLGVSATPVNGNYLSRVNPKEAEVVCEAALQFMIDHPDKSLGIATLNQPQRQMIHDMIEQRLSSSPEAENYYERWEQTIEPFFVKNLENVQGDERDVIFISTVYGPDEDGKLRQSFGPITYADGFRRLNVLFTRAKERVHLFTSMKPEQIIVGETSSRGVRALKAYLSYAITGESSPQVAETKTGAREPDSDFEVEVARHLTDAGFAVVPQVGVSGFFIDIGVRDSRDPDQFILGVECDGASYHSSRSARDRDRLRQDVLENLGWQIYRIWSTDWFRDPDEELRKLIGHLHDLEGRLL